MNPIDSPIRVLIRSFETQRFSFGLYTVVLAVLMGLFATNIQIPLLGSHPWRQADTLFTGYFFCFEDNDISRPRVAQRENTSGIAIGEFPLYSWIISLPCQLTGQWSEVTPKVISFLLFISTSLLFAVAVFRRFRTPVWDMAVLILSSEVMISFLTRTLPDGLALFLLACASVIWTGGVFYGFLTFRNLIAAALALLAFAVRPYLVPIIFLFMPWGPLRIAFMSYALWWVYQKWFIEWTQTATFQYYLVHRKPLDEALQEAAESFGPFLRQTAKDHLNYVLIPFFIAGFYRRFRLPLLWIGSAVLVVLVSGKHFSLHAYYMLSAGLMALIIAGIGLPRRSLHFRKFLLVAFAGIGIANTQHYFHKPRDPDWNTTADLVDSVSPYKTKIATLNPMADFVPIWLYFAKRTGWSMLDTPENRARACSLGVTAVLIKESDKLSIQKCENP